MDADALDDAIEDLRKDRAALQQRLDTLRADFDRFLNKFQPGTKFLVDLEYKLVFDGTITVAASTLQLSSVIETLPGTLHALYGLSAYAPSSNTPVLITDGSVIVAPSNAVTVALQRQRQTSPTRIETKVAVYNATASSADIAVRVYRRLGVGGSTAA